MEKKIIQKNGINVYVEINNGIINIESQKPIPDQLTTIPKIALNEVIGREDDISEVYRLLTNSDKAVSLSGLGGIGKTILAKAILQKHKKEYKHIAWLNITSGLKEAFVFSTKLVDSLALRKDIEHLDKEKIIDDAFELITHRMSQLKGKNILILDNVDKEVENTRILDSIYLSDNWKVLVTTRQKLEGFIEYELGLLTPGNAKKLFYLYYTREKEDTTVLDILEMIDSHTLAIEVISKTSQARRLKLNEILERLKKKGLCILKGAQTKFFHNHNQNAMNVFEYLLETFNIADLSDDEGWVLMQFSVLPSLYIKYESNETGSIKKILLFEKLEEDLRDRITDIINSVVSKGWLIWNEEDDSFKMHQVIQDIVRYRLKPNTKSCYALINGLSFTIAKKLEKNPIDAAIYIPHAESILSSINDDSIDLATLANNLQVVFKALGMYRKALQYGLKDIAICEKILSENDPKLVTSYSNIGDTYRELGDLEKSLNFGFRALAIGENVLDENHLSLGSCFNNIAETYRLLGNYKNSIEFNKKALNIFEHKLGENHPDLAVSYNNIGSAYLNFGDLEKALEYDLKALAIREKNLDINHPDLAVSYNNIAITYEKLGNFDRSLEYALKAIAIGEKILDENNLDLANYYNTTAICYYHLKDFKQAEKYIDKAVAIRERVPDIPPHYLKHSLQDQKMIHQAEVRDKIVDIIKDTIKSIASKESINLEIKQNSHDVKQVNKKCMVDSKQILRQIREQENILVGKSLLEQLSSSLYIFADVEEVMETAQEIRPYSPHLEVIGLYSEMLKISLKVQLLSDGIILLAGIHEVHDRGGISNKDFQWHECEEHLVESRTSVSFNTSEDEMDVSCFKCPYCGYTAFNVDEADRI